jgi:hypothetical protein
LLSMRTSSSNAKSAAGQVQHAWGWYVSEMPSGASSLAKLVYGNYIPITSWFMVQLLLC